MCYRRNWYTYYCLIPDVYDDARWKCHLMDVFSHGLFEHVFCNGILLPVTCQEYHDIWAVANSSTRDSVILHMTHLHSSRKSRYLSWHSPFCVYSIARYVKVDQPICTMGQWFNAALSLLCAINRRRVIVGGRFAYLVVDAWRGNSWNRRSIFCTCCAKSIHFFPWKTHPLLSNNVYINFAVHQLGLLKSRKVASK